MPGIKPALGCWCSPVPCPAAAQRRVCELCCTVLAPDSPGWELWEVGSQKVPEGAPQSTQATVGLLPLWNDLHVLTLLLAGVLARACRPSAVGIMSCVKATLAVAACEYSERCGLMFEASSLILQFTLKEIACGKH